MRTGTVLALLVLAVAVAGCLGTSPGEDVDPAAEIGEATEATVAAVDHSQPADAASKPLETRLPSADVEPTAEGELATRTLDYDFGQTIVNDTAAGPTYPAQLTGSVTFPTEGEGPHTVVVLLHGRHFTCKVADQQGILATQACPEAAPVAEPIDSYQGYGYLAENLASHGFAVVSIDANDVNDRDAIFAGDDVEGQRVGGDAGVQARAQLVLRTLDGFQQVDQGEDPGPLTSDNGEIVDALADRLRLEDVGLVGHSRGGDGVTYAVGYNERREQGTPHDIAAVFAIAPTDFRATSVTGVAYAVLLPYCDGDVSNLWGAEIFDRSRYLPDAGPQYQFVAMGANHVNYNTEWPENLDDAAGYDDPFCGSYRQDGGGRLTAEDQRRHGEALVASFVHAHVASDAEHEPWLAGRAQAPAGACPAGEAPCPGLLATSYHPPADERLVLEAVTDGQALDENDLGGDVRIAGNVSASVCTPPECPSSPNRQLATQLTLAWDSEGRYALELPDEHRDVSAYGWLSARTGVNFDEAANAEEARQGLTVELVDEQGNRARVSADEHGAALFVPPGQTGQGAGAAEVTLSAIGVPLDAFEGVDRTRVDEISFVTDRTDSGSVQLADVMLQR